MNTTRPETMTWIPANEAWSTFENYSDTPIPDHADCFGLPNRYDYSDGMVRFPANGYPGQDAGVSGYVTVSVCPFCGKWWHWDHKMFTDPGVIVD